MKWTWLDNSVDIDGRLYGVEVPEYAALKAFDYLVERAAKVYTTLEDARDSYSGGRASYANATAEIKHLLDESNKAALDLLDVCSGVEKWIPKVVALFDGHGDTLIAFCREFIARQGPDPGVLGNLLRARGASSPRAPLSPAPSVKPSSSIPTGKSSDPGSTSGSESPPRTAPDVNGS